MAIDLYIFDVDDTLITSFLRRSQRSFKQSREDPEGTRDLYDRVEVLPGRLDALENLALEGHLFALATNQGGVAFGFQTEEQVRAKLGRVVDSLHFFHGQPFSVHVCYSHPKAPLVRYRADDPRRKPGLGMILEALVAHGVEPEHAIYVGDLPTDAQAAAAAGVAYQHPDEFFGPQTG